MKSKTILLFICVILLAGSVTALNPDFSCAPATQCRLNFIVTNSTGYQVSTANCSYILLKSSDLTAYGNGAMLLNLTAPGAPYYFFDLNIAVADTYDIKLSCNLTNDEVANYFSTIIISNYATGGSNISVNYTINLNVSTTTNYNTSGKVGKINFSMDASNVSMTSCEANVYDLLMRIGIIVVGIIMAFVGIAKKKKGLRIIGFIGSVIVIVGGLLFTPCMAIVGIVIALLGIVFAVSNIAG